MGPLWPTAFLKSMGPGVIVPPCPPSRWPCSCAPSVDILYTARSFFPLLCHIQSKDTFAFAFLPNFFLYKKPLSCLHLFSFLSELSYVNVSMPIVFWFPAGVRTKLQKFLRSYVEGVYTIQNGAYERNGLTAYSVGGHNIVLNWITEITDL